MRLLLDTHVVLWWLADSPKLGPTLRGLIADGSNDVLVSAVSVAEIAIKQSTGKLTAPPDLLDALAEQGLQELPLLSTHAAALRTLPLHHRDPFDRMLIAQALTEQLVFATYDPAAAQYGVSTITG